ncbi:hypothetical protein V1477_013761, partial [Vespula maculifrons]
SHPKINQPITDLDEHQIIINITNKHSNKISYRRDYIKKKTKQNRNKNQKTHTKKNRNILHPNKYNTSKPRSILNKGPKVYREECMRRVVANGLKITERCAPWAPPGESLGRVGTREYEEEKRERRKRKRRDGGGSSGGGGGGGGGGVWGGLKCTTEHRGDATPACGRESRRGP